MGEKIYLVQQTCSWADGDQKKIVGVTPDNRVAQAVVQNATTRFNELRRIRDDFLNNVWYSSDYTHEAANCALEELRKHTKFLEVDEFYSYDIIEIDAGYFDLTDLDP